MLIAASGAAAPRRLARKGKKSRCAAKKAPFSARKRYSIKREAD
jgi:hypothetical protein